MLSHFFGDDSTVLRRWHAHVIASVLLVIAMVSMYPQVYPPNMLPVILEEEVFVGRETKLEVLTDMIGNSTIISVVGSPGFGKSTLAVHVGHKITEKGGVVVHYTDLYEEVDMTTLNEKLTWSLVRKDNVVKIFLGGLAS